MDSARIISLLTQVRHGAACSSTPEEHKILMENKLIYRQANSWEGITEKGRKVLSELSRAATT